MQTKSTIRKSIKGLFLAALLACGAIACKKDKDKADAPPPPPPVSQKLKEVKTGDEFIRFDYNAAGDVNKVTITNDLINSGEPTVFNIQYDAAKRITELAANDEKIVPVYDNNRLSRADIFEAGERIGYTNYLYQNGLLNRATLYFGEDTEYFPFVEFNFTYNDAGNITEMVTLITNGEPGHMVRSGHINYQYDQKSNPLYLQRDLLALFWQSANKNNVLVEDHFDSELLPEDKYVYTYQYNDKGLPKSAVVKQGLPGQPPVTTNQTFTYQ